MDHKKLEQQINLLEEAFVRSFAQFLNKEGIGNGQVSSSWIMYGNSVKLTVTFPTDYPHNKIETAFRALDKHKQNLDGFLNRYNIAVSTLRQYKRFDKTGLGGKIKIQMDKHTRLKYVWREPNKTLEGQDHVS